MGATETPAIIRRSDIGLAIAGTRISLYTLIDYLHEGWSAHEISTLFNLSDEQLESAIKYIAKHRSEVEAEYQEVIQEAEERRHYWEERLREHLAHATRTRPSPEKAQLYAKLAEQRAQTIRELAGDDSPMLAGTDRA